MNAVFSATWLMAQQFPPLEYFVPGIIPAGATLVVAAPKTGKSWLMLDLAAAVASGGCILGGIRTGRPRPVLYLALEDGPRRLQDRLRALGVTAAPAGLDFATSVERGDVLATLTEWVTAHADANPLAIVDTLGKVMPTAAAGESDYQRDYRIGGQLKGIVDTAPGSALIVVHHTRKAQADDFLDTVSGTQGLAGSADSIVVLRRPRNSATGTLSVTSRDAAEGEYQVTMAEGRWTLDGGDLAQAAAAAAKTRTMTGLGERSADVVEVVNRNPEGIRAATVAATLGIDADTAGRYLRRAADADRIEKTGRGLYTPVRSVRSVRSESSPLSDPVGEPDNRTLRTPISGDDPGYCSGCGMPPDRCKHRQECADAKVVMA